MWCKQKEAPKPVRNGQKSGLLCVVYEIFDSRRVFFYLIYLIVKFLPVKMGVGKDSKIKKKAQ